MGHGDSIVIELAGPQPKIVVVDAKVTKRRGLSVNPVAEFLRNKNVTTIDLAVVTHFHDDHYSGYGEILDRFNIRRLLIPPVISRNEKVFKKIQQNLRARLLRTASLTNDPEIIGADKAFAKLLRFICTKRALVEEATGKNNVVMLPDAPSVRFYVYLPLSNIRGKLQSWARSRPIDFNTFSETNDTSIALGVEYAGHRLLLAGDSTANQWEEHRAQMRREGVTSLNFDSLKVAHHGSKHNNSRSLYEYILRSGAGRHVLVSADGRSHPHDAFFELVVPLSLTPRCTNLAMQCTAGNVVPFIPRNNIPPSAWAFVRNYDVRVAPIPCQGDITLTIDSAGAVSVLGSTGAPCVYS